MTETVSKLVSSVQFAIATNYQKVIHMPVMRSEVELKPGE